MHIMYFVQICPHSFPSAWPPMSLTTFYPNLTCNVLNDLSPFNVPMYMSAEPPTGERVAS